jgi:hypothetical protein
MFSSDRPLKPKLNDIKHLLPSCPCHLPFCGTFFFVRTFAGHLPTSGSGSRVETDLRGLLGQFPTFLHAVTAVDFKPSSIVRLHFTQRD